MRLTTAASVWLCASLALVGCGDGNSGGSEVGGGGASPVATCEQQARVGYGGGRFIVLRQRVGFKTYAVAYSDNDGQTWRSAEGPRVPAPVDIIAYGNGVFVSVGVQFDDEYADQGWSATSTDGLEWSHAIEGEPFYGLAFAGGLFHTARASESSSGAAYILSSPDGASWTSTPAPLGFYVFAYGEGRYVGAAQLTQPPRPPVVAMSADGTTWTTLDATWTYQWWGALVPFHGGLVGVRPDRRVVDRGDVGFTADLQTYTDTLHADLVLAPFRDELVGADRAADGGVYTTNDGPTWTRRGTIPGGGGVIAASPTAVIVTNGCTLLRSTDGTTFEDVPLP